jgi:DNA sulfur modification protein DndB
MERSTLSPRSRKLFTLSALYGATQSLLGGLQFPDVNEAADMARSYWELVAEQIPEWQAVRRGSMTAGEVRQDFIHSHGIALAAIGRVGNTLLSSSSKADDWAPSLVKLSSVDWSRANTKQWEGRAMIGGRVSKANTNVILTTNALRRHLDLPLSPEEQRIEEAYEKGKR